MSSAVALGRRPNSLSPALGSMQSWLYGLRGLGWQLELETPRRLSAELGEPMSQIPAVHIAGTNGKGSMVRMIGSILQASGLRVGMYTSPHLVHLAQRVEIQGRPVANRALAKSLDAVRKACGRLRGPRHPSFFECMTAAAFLLFRDLGVQVAVVETGLGGRYDATRIMPWVLAHAFGPISLEHTDRLGKTISKIAGEKAALLRPGVPGVVSMQTREAMKVFVSSARQEGAPLFVYGKDFEVLSTRVTPKGTRLSASFSKRSGLPRSMDFFTSMVGRHQAQNAVASILTADLALKSLDLNPTQSVIQSGLRRAWVAGRVQIVPGQPLHILDTACNPGALEVLVSTTRELYNDRKIVLCAGFLNDKDIQANARILRKLTRKVVLTEPPVKLRALPAKYAARAFRKLGIEAITEKNPVKALYTARKMAGSRGLVVVTGSLYLVGDLMQRDASLHTRIG